MNRIRIIIGKEWVEVFKNKMVFFTITFLPLFFVVMPLVIMYFIGREPEGSDRVNVPMEMLASPMFAGMSASEIGQVLIVNQFLFFFLMIPLIIPTSIAAYSIVGEKQQRSLEPLLATPVSTGELLLGKSLAAALPAVGVTWLAYAIFITAGRFVAVSDRVFGLMVAPMWLLAIGVLAPLFTVLAVNIAVIVSSRVNEPRVAEQLSGLVVLPIILVSLAFIVGRIMLTLETFTAGVLITVVIDVVVLYLGVRLFQRETILTKWK